ncbi:MAG: DUF3987 domain-containing protein [Xanthomonadales bacterium]|nr:DUF3987 domain-containing protein [Xanthomonadales bacterium]
MATRKNDDTARRLLQDFPNSHFLQWAAKNEESRESITTFIGLMLTPEAGAGWRGMFAVPPASALEIVLATFKKETDIPLEIPFFATLHFVSGMLLKNGSTMEGPAGTISPELWTVVLADSGAGKTFATKIIERAAGVEDMALEEPASGAKLLASMAEKPTSLWTQDEIAQKLKQIEDPKSPMGDAKEYLLRAYDNAKIQRATKKETITVENPRLGILGLNTKESFRKAMSPESLLDGFAQRFGFVYAEDDKSRPMIDFALYQKPKIEAACKRAFDKIRETPLHKEYILGPAAVQAFETSFVLLARDGTPKSFFRRAMFRAFRYAMLYHVLLGKKSNVIDEEDIGWGARVVSLHLADMGKILGTDEKMKFMADTVKKARSMQERFKSQNKAFTARSLQQGLREINNADDAKALFDMVSK